MYDYIIELKNSYKYYYYLITYIILLYYVPFITEISVYKGRERSLRGFQSRL
jgi:hypothetical protein